MCGIAAILDKGNNKPKLSYMQSMLDALSHRGPDGEGMMIYDNVALGHRRLAILDIDSRSDQPMHLDQLSLVFNGLIFNYVELKAELVALGHQFQTTSDTEVILHAYQEWGLAGFKRFNGMWAFVLLDKQKRKLICSRDRYGIKPLYYASIGDQLVLGSEIKALATHPQWQASINAERVYEYLAYNMQDHTDETMYAGVKCLPRAHHMLIDMDTHQIQKEPYYSIEQKEASNPEEWMALWQNALSMRTRADVSYACTLSGGMDSSSLVSSMAHHLGLQPEVYSLQFDHSEVDESAYARMVSEQYGLKQHWLSPDYTDMLATLDRHLQIQDEPFTGTTVWAQHALYEQISADGHKVSLGGQGGDEILAGYEKFVFTYYKSLINKPHLLLSELLLFARHNPVPWHQIIDKYTKMRESRNAGIASWYTGQLDEDRLYRRPKENTVFDVSRNLLSGLGISALLRYEDRNSMANGIESRLPFLDHRLVELSLHLPDHEKIAKGRTKALLRKQMKGIVPQAIIDRKDKMGLETPEKQWLSDPQLLRYIEENIDSLPFVDGEKAMPLVLSDLKFRWRMLSLIRWCKLNNM